MPDPLPGSRILRFGSYEADPKSGELRKNGIKLRIQDQPFTVLLILLEKPGEVVTREQFRERLWSADTFVDFDHGLSASINKLRQVLDDDANNPRFVATVGRRGYRFIAPVHPPVNGQSPDVLPLGAAGFESGQPATRESVHPPEKKHRPFGKWGWLAVLAACAFGATVAVLLYDYFYGHTLRIDHITQLTHSGRVDGFGPFVTDGSRVFFLERDGDHWNNMQISTSGGEGSPFPMPFRNTVIFDLSPDKAQLLIAPFISRTGNLPLWGMPLVGGAPRRLGDLFANSARFSPDGQRIALAKDDGIYVADLTGMNQRKLAATSGDCTRVVWSPNGKRLRFTVGDPATQTASIWELVVNTGKVRRLLPNWKAAQGEWGGSWTPDGAYFIFLAMQNGRGDLWALREPPAFFPWLQGNPIRLTQGPSAFGDPHISSDPHVLYAGGGAEELEAVTVDPATRLLKPFLYELHPKLVYFSPDGKSILYVSEISLWRSRLDGGERFQLVADVLSRPISFPRWSPDSRRILFMTPSGSGFGSISVMPAEGGAVQTVLAGDYPFGSADWGPDGQQIVFTRLRQKDDVPDKKEGLYIYDLRDSKMTKIPKSEGIGEVRWSPDGHFLAAITQGSSALRLYDMNKREWAQLATGKLMGMPAWTRDSTYVYSQDVLAPGEPIFRFLAERPVKEEFYSFEDVLQARIQRCGFEGVAPDGSLLLRLTHNSSDVYRIALTNP